MDDGGNGVRFPAREIHFLLIIITGRVLGFTQSPTQRVREALSSEVKAAGQ
jgi:hypothetical protein